ncbi:MAG: GYF domain-containing protein [Oligoflexia bacterium]|nr:GYF domain-containing protein [Oligoflexia bacterium]
MENTLNLLLEDTALKWYTVVNSRPVGPLSAKEIVQRIQAGELNLASHIWKEGFSSWTRLYDVIDFKPLLPAEPSVSLIAEIQKSTQASPPPLAPKQKEELRTWYIYLDESNYGPISDIEVQSLIQSGRVKGTTYIWQKGFADWQQAKEVDVWKKLLAGQAIPATQAKPDKRATPRKPFEAKILLTDGKEVGWALCRDISVGGMQVLMDHSPGPAGTQLKLNVNPATGVPGFACEGVIVRTLEDGRGFSFRFTQLSAEAKGAIENYIKS